MGVEGGARRRGQGVGQSEVPRGKETTGMATSPTTALASTSTYPTPCPRSPQGDSPDLTLDVSPGADQHGPLPASALAVTPRPSPPAPGGALCRTTSGMASGWVRSR